MRLTLRVLALVSLAVFGLALLLYFSSYLKNPCPQRFLFKLGLVIFGVFGLSPALIGGALAAGLAVARRQWGWLIGLLAAMCFVVAFLYGAAVDHPPLVVQGAVTALAWAFDHALGLTVCGSQSSLLTQAAAVMLLLMAAPIALLSYSFWGASGAPRRTISE